MLIPVSDRTFFSDRTGHPVQRAGEEITANVWRGLVPLIQRRIADGSLARDFPLLGCEDGDFITGTDEQMFIDSLRAHVPQAADWPLNPARLPATPVALDILEFVAMHLVQPSGRSPHSYFRHPHLFFRDDQWLDAATEQFRHDVDLIFARNGIAFTFGDDLRIRRLGPVEARQLISEFRPKTGDVDLDAKLLDAMTRFISRAPADRQDALEKLWDAFERLKTLEPGKNKKETAAKLLARVAGANPPRSELEAEFLALTKIGNNFTIRHHERDRHELPDDRARDYPFIRMASLIAYVLRQTGRIEA